MQETKIHFCAFEPFFCCWSPNYATHKISTNYRHVCYCCNMNSPDARFTVS